MPHRLHTIELGFGATAIALFGSIGSSVSRAVATVDQSIPTWASPFIGPLGALIGAGFVVKWLANRLAKQDEESKRARDEDNRRRDEHQQTLLGLVTAQTDISVRCQLSIDKNTEVMEAVAEHLKNRQ